MISVEASKEPPLDHLTSSYRASREQLAVAVHQNQALSREGILERLFTFLFSGLVYPQIWEDPVVDMDALSINRTDHIVAIASGGCNVASYLIAQPAQITAVDLNAAHISLNKLKLAAIKHSPDYTAFRRFFVDASDARNITTYQAHFAPNLDVATRNYWAQRSISGRRRIAQFGAGFYRHGLLGTFIGLVHALARLHGYDLRRVLEAGNAKEQRELYELHVAPLFEKPLIRWLAGQPASLYGLGIPPAQYRTLAGDHHEGMIGALRARVEKLAFGFPLQDNYFAWQAFGRAYGTGQSAPLPPYLQAENFSRIRPVADRVQVLHISMSTHLETLPAASADCYVLLDAQDWMNDADLNTLWAQISRTARPGARVIFRTAADERLLPGRVAPAILDLWRRDDARSAALHERDRSAIYGAFHLYRLKDSHQ
jgi:S-adenosylmethionine-diacylglycerol 3-amino-3-carboxypropyl transferase